MNNKIARIINGKIVYSDQNAKPVKSNEMSAKHNREAMKVRHRKDLVQPNEIAFGRAYPEKTREMYGDETARLLS